MAPQTTKEMLLAAATEMFAEYGYNQVSVRDICRKCNTSISMITYHFGGKEGLYQKVLRKQFSCYSAIRRLAADKSSPLVRLEKYVIWALDRHRTSPHFSKIYLRELMSPSGYYETHLKPLVLKSKQCLMKILDDGMRQGDITDKIDPEAMAHIISTTINCIGIYSDIHSQQSPVLGSRDPIDARDILALLRPGIKARTCTEPCHST
ncbi:hypothetical protein GMLC_28630 [Geomonas limicola]|uniref:HTH tetR-type domain-containing protein n=1 Tax=Geomonas limicola TaxID=2740186 RepID=A0A6V8NBR4_9BACT|nr:TetR/AcrR family transcriptional regulator [Geomonas limicola]GFO69284.1 hypothetical protein GMLC_28630 [Geomonas limicola]